MATGVPREGSPAGLSILVWGSRVGSSGPALRGSGAGPAGSCPLPTWRRGRRVLLAGSRGSGAVRFGSGVTVPSPPASSSRRSRCYRRRCYRHRRRNGRPRTARSGARARCAVRLGVGHSTRALTLGRRAPLAFLRSGGPGAPSSQPRTESPPVGDPLKSTKEE